MTLTLNTLISVRNGNGTREVDRELLGVGSREAALVRVIRVSRIMMIIRVI